MYVYKYIYMYTYKYIHICVYMYMYIYIYVYAYGDGTRFNSVYIIGGFHISVHIYDTIASGCAYALVYAQSVLFALGDQGVGVQLVYAEHWLLGVEDYF